MPSKIILSDVPSRLHYQFDSVLLDANECFATSAGLSDCNLNPVSFHECYPDSEPPQVPSPPIWPESVA